MTYQEAEQMVKRITYRPASVISMTETHRGTEVSIQLGIIDIHGKGANSSLTGSYKIDLSCVKSETQMIQAVWEAIERIERHERQEWLKIDGQQFYNPHAVL